ncbi:MAG: helix-turn-helix domain-containing protein [Anaerolineae bacterium]|jgi:excisionase family DNA binding protein|nr:helix-turn-helix domain-containing protein [Anaerolineae bacterium]
MSDGGKRIINSNAVYSRQEAAEVLGVSLSTLKKLIDAGYLRVSQPAGIRRIFIQGSSILEMLDQTAVERQA